MRDANYYLNLLAGGGDTALESTGSETDMSAARVTLSIDALKRQLNSAGAHALDNDKADRLLDAAAKGLEKLSGDGNDAALNEDEVFGIEAVILTDGSRPALFVQDNAIPLQRAVLGEWHADAQMHEQRISATLRSIGRIDNQAASQAFSGTGFVIDSGVVVTNRHVLEAITVPPRPPDPGASWTLRPNIEINFGYEFERSSGLGYAITKVLYAGPDAINNAVNFDHLDMAVLECATDSAFPPAIRLAEPQSSIGTDSKIYVVGYPAKPRFEEANVLTDIFANTFGHKRWAPGKIKKGVGALAGDIHQWVVSHDASTLGGNSGSAALLFEGSGDVCVGLHFAGLARDQNYAHVIARIRQQLGAR